MKWKKFTFPGSDIDGSLLITDGERVMYLESYKELLALGNYIKHSHITHYMSVTLPKEDKEEFKKRRRKEIYIDYGDSEYLYELFGDFFTKDGE